MADEAEYTNAGELFEALGTQDAIERRGVLAWIAQNPAEAIALGTLDGRDVVDVLISIVPRNLPYGMWEDLAIAIGAFDAPRVSDFFLDVLARSETTAEATDAAGQLERRDRSQLRDGLTAIVAAEGPPERIAAAADLIAGETGLPPRVAVIVAALEEETEPPPLGDAVVIEAWLEQLGGPFASSARDRLQQQGAGALALILAESERLPEDDREWLRTAMAELGADAVEPLRDLVREGSPTARIEATAALLELGDDEWLRGELLEPGD